MSVRPTPRRTRAPRPHRRGLRPLAVTLGAVVLVVGGCGGSEDAQGACGDEVVEPVDPQSAVHVLPGAPVADGPGDLPTSGIHVMDPAVEVVSDEPLSSPIAVGVLERSGVVIEYGPEVDASAQADLEALATDEEGTVVVAPADDLPAPVVARAWRHRLECSSADTARLEEFVDAHLGTGSAMTAGASASTEPGG